MARSPENEKLFELQTERRGPHRVSWFSLVGRRPAQSNLDGNANWPLGSVRKENAPWRRNFCQLRNATGEQVEFRRFETIGKHCADTSLDGSRRELARI
jgi:hypothetical protein